MSENVENKKVEEKKRGFIAETKSFYSDVGSAVKNHKMGKVIVGTAIGILGTTAVVVGTIFGVKKIRGRADSANYIPEDAKDVTPPTEE